MPVFLASLWGGLLNIAGTLAGQVLIGLGVSVVTFTGVNTTLGWAKTQMLNAIQGLPAEVIGMLSAMGAGVFISIVTSAITVRMTLDGLSAAGSIKKFVKK